MNDKKEKMNRDCCLFADNLIGRYNLLQFGVITDDDFFEKIERAV